MVLLVSRSCIGRMAGRINAAIFREHLFVGKGDREVCTETVNDLRLEGIRGDGEVAESLSAQARKIYHRHLDSRTPLFNITGGFKGLIPVITIICMRDNRTMLYLHDSMKGTIRLRFEGGQEDEQYEDVNTPI